MSFTDFIIPVFVVLVLIYGIIHKVDIFAEFTNGVKEGLSTIYGIFPSLFCLVVTIAVFPCFGRNGTAGTVSFSCVYGNRFSR